MEVSTNLSPAVVITTKNRASDLCRAVESALSQTREPHVVVVDDGSTDGTSEIITARYRDIDVITYKESDGYIARRNEAAKKTTCDVIFSLDDDAVYSTPYIIEQTLKDFVQDPRIAAVAIPCVDVLKEDRLRLPFPPTDEVYITSEFIGTAHAVRRDLFLELKGFRESLVHQGEERDFCLRLLDAGYVVRLGTSDPIHHFESPKRDLARQDFYGRRNDVLFAFHNAPALMLPLHVMGTAVNGFRFGLQCGRPLRMAKGIMQGILDGAKTWHDRSAVSSDTYRLSRVLRRRGLVPISEAAGRLKNVAPAQCREPVCVQ